jgi:nitrogen fixation NifU-like protein
VDSERYSDLGKHNDNFVRHANLPANMGTIADPDGKAVGVGQCGDAIEVTLRVVAERIAAIRYVPRGCVFTLACASAMSVMAENKTLDQALDLSPQDVERLLGGLPEDHLHCARLAINTLGEAIADCYRRRRAGRSGGCGRVEEEERSDAHL